MTTEQARFLVQYFAQLMEGESAATCSVLRAVPNDRRDYKPDEKSRTAWELATHLAGGDVWFLDSILQGSFAFDPAAEAAQRAGFKTVDEVVAFYERELPERLKQIREMPDEHLTRIVDFFGMFQRPAAAYMGFANNHSTHHRGQLAAYLRAMGSKVPAIYGASADVGMEAAGQ
jgi:uncharacterized damage-inducible protein DinB